MPSTTTLIISVIFATIFGLLALLFLYYYGITILGISIFAFKFFLDVSHLNGRRWRRRRTLAFAELNVRQGRGRRRARWAAEELGGKGRFWRVEDEEGGSKCGDVERGRV